MLASQKASRVTRSDAKCEGEQESLLPLVDEVRRVCAKASKNPSCLSSVDVRENESNGEHDQTEMWSMPINLYNSLNLMNIY